jgi:hypothetical protein
MKRRREERKEKSITYIRMTEKEKAYDSKIREEKHLYT